MPSQSPADPQADLLARAAAGDRAAQARFTAARTARVQARESFTASGRAAARRMLRPEGVTAR
ncbi:hypothetical protein [Streptomyces sp. NBC_01244]|uniref:hypothetical protein n=1 Tax=Streptomyces sp. NBC_01244 TaxID=2903797 RepID=UPI002E122DB2|nr:hypothetical protein OG247_44075 [Streptomyces sp. NBC_01244]